MIAPAPPAHQGLGPLWPPELSSPGAPRRTEPAVGVSSRRRLGPGAKLVPTDATVQELVGQGCQGAKTGLRYCMNGLALTFKPAAAS